MPEIFTVKVRKVGTSLGVLIPKEIVEGEGIKEGEDVEISLIKRKRLQEVLELFGTAGHSAHFERERVERIERW